MNYDLFLTAEQFGNETPYLSISEHAKLFGPPQGTVEQYVYRLAEELRNEGWPHVVICKGDIIMQYDNRTRAIVTSK
jgi:hypothetical protein